VSFIPLKLVLPAALALARPPAETVVLIKPQFEAGPDHVKKGLVRDPVIHERVCADVAALITSLDWTVMGLIPSPIAGGDGNHEFLIAGQQG
jgi:23S rRNA (cytidine1920-2'-O)/16S rRNA (cytidine1409-2'-O)-methyltransferase